METVIATENPGQPAPRRQQARSLPREVSPSLQGPAFKLSLSLRERQTEQGKKDMLEKGFRRN